MELAARYLATRPRSAWEVERRLRRAGAGPEVIEATIARLIGLGYVDDLAFGRWWIGQRDRHAPRGQRMIEAELRQHGVPRDIIDALRTPADEPPADAGVERLPETEEERAEIALARHLRGRPLPTEAVALQRVGMFLVRRGFDPETVRRTLRAAGKSRTP